MKTLTKNIGTIGHQHRGFACKKPKYVLDVFVRLMMYIESGRWVVNIICKYVQSVLIFFVPQRIVEVQNSFWSQRCLNHGFHAM